VVQAVVVLSAVRLPEAEASAPEAVPPVVVAEPPAVPSAVRLEAEAAVSEGVPVAPEAVAAPEARSAVRQRGVEASVSEAVPPVVVAEPLAVPSAVRLEAETVVPEAASPVAAEAVAVLEARSAVR
jgi:hypothetical protein